LTTLAWRINLRTAREQYQVLLWRIPLERGRVETLRGEMQGGTPPLAIFAITSER
jgi:hypothetical protein